jgi:hypothetical protein
VQLATAKEKTLKARSLEGFNEAQIELEKLAIAREKIQTDLNLRIALAARSHQSQSTIEI